MFDELYFYVKKFVPFVEVVDYISTMLFVIVPHYLFTCIASVMVTLFHYSSGNFCFPSVSMISALYYFFLCTYFWLTFLSYFPKVKP